MDTIGTLQKIIDYIEENLNTEITAEELADRSGFSIYHFYHIFGAYMGMPVVAYITKRRLQHAVYQAQGGKNLVDVALEYGFDTHAGFYKAFKREYGCSPTKYLKITSVKKPVLVNLKKEAKILLTQTQIRQLLTNWNIDAKEEIGPSYQGGGIINNTWPIGEKYIFKTGRNISWLRTHIQISNALEAHEIAITSPIKTKNNEDFLIVNDQFYVLFNRVEGNHLTTEDRYNSERIGMGEKYGKAIGQLHKILEAETENLEVNDKDMYLNIMDWALPETKKAMEQWGAPLPEDFYNEFTDNFTELYPKLPRHVIHRDANPSNIIFKNGEISGYIDFDISEKNIRLFDPCYCSTGILSEAGNIDGGYEKWSELLTGIIKGYDEVCSLSDAEKKAIPYVIYSIQMTFIAWLGNREEYKNLAMTNRKMLLWLWENKDKCFYDL